MGPFREIIPCDHIQFFLKIPCKEMEKKNINFKVVTTGDPWISSLAM
jgi:hypothetical protein